MNLLRTFNYFILHLIFLFVRFRSVIMIKLNEQTCSNFFNFFCSLIRLSFFGTALNLQIILIKDSILTVYLPAQMYKQLIKLLKVGNGILI